jgi:hypothetical protein
VKRQLLVPIIGLAIAAAGGAWALTAARTTAIDSFAACRDAGYVVSDTNPPACSDGHHTFLGPRATAAASTGPVESVGFQLLVDGDSGGRYPRGQQVINTAADWAEYWRTVHAGLAQEPPLLPVDFAHSTVVALSEGQQPTGGYSFKVTGITTRATGTAVAVTETVPGPGCMVPQAVSNRYFIVHSDSKLTEPVSFRLSTVKRAC